MNLSRTISEIKSLKIQGARDVALDGLRALKTVILKSKAKNHKQLYAQIKHAQSQLVKTRPTEPFLRNVTKWVLLHKPSRDVTLCKSQLLSHLTAMTKSIMLNQEIIAKAGAKKIPRGGVVFTHCHSSSVMAVFKEAHKKKKFIVHNTEARPRYQGRITAKELSAQGIKTVHFVDAAARLALKGADAMFIGCDAITKHNIINKIGSELFVEAANRFHVPVYVVSDSLKFDPVTLHGKREIIEKRSADEVWKNPPKNIKIVNYAFERIDPKLVTGIISELGIFSHKQFLREIKHHYPWLRKKKHFM